MDDKQILQQIQAMVRDEHELRSGLAEGTVTSAEEHARLRELEVELDRCWDLLRQRRARREFGEDPADATTRPPGEVEDYQQ